MLRDHVLLSLIAAFALSPPSGYAQSHPIQIFDKSFARTSSQALLSVKNDLVAVQVRATNDTSLSGEISFAGVFNMGTADNRPLSFQFPQAPFSSHVNIRVDNTIYSNDPRRTNSSLLRMTSARVVGDSLLECSYQAGPIAVRQRLHPQKFSATTGAIFIEFLLHNTDPTNNHQAGVLLELDTFINGNDQAPVLTNFGYSRSEQKFVAPQIPDFLQAFQIGNPADSTGLVAQGTLVGYEAVRPDQLIIGDWSRLSTVPWDYEVPASPPRYDDSAVILRWNEQNLAANQSRTIATYYGLGDVSTRRDAVSGLTLHLTALRNLGAVRGQLTPNPFEVNLLVFNRVHPAVNAVQARLILPPPLALASGDFAVKALAPSNLSTTFNNGTASWTVVAQCPATALEIPMRVEVSGLVGANSVSAAVTRPLFLPSCAQTQPAFKLKVQPQKTAVRPNERATFQISLEPLFGFNQTVTLAIWPPAVPGVTTSLSPVQITPGQNATLLLQTDQNVRPGEYLFLMIGEGGGLIGSDSITVQVLAADFGPPYAANLNPPREARQVPLRASIFVDVLDDDSGIDPVAIAMTVNNRLVPLQISPVAKGYRLHYTPPARWNDDQLIHVKLQAQDLAIPPNAFADEYFFTTVRDSLPPRALNFSPAPFATGISPQTEISLQMEDDLTGVDFRSLRLQINGMAVTPDSSRISNGFALHYRLVGQALSGDTVHVTIAGQDLAARPNAASFSYFFVLGQDRQPPFVASRNPEPGAVNVPPEEEISVAIVDVQAGVDLQMLIMEVNGQRVSPQILGDSRAAHLKYQPAKPWLFNAVVSVGVRAQDLAVPPNVMPLDTFSFTIAPPRPDLIAGDLQAAELFALGRSTRVQGKIRALGAEVNQHFQLEFFGDGEQRGDTTITALPSGAEIEVETRLRFDTPGTHIVEMVVDAGNAIVESDENNNRRQLVVNLAGSVASKLIVRPNPFTPNGDGYNDAIEFNFSGLNLDSPSLHIFDANGVPVWVNKPQNGKIYAWDGRDEEGKDLQPGVYLYTLLDGGSNVASGYVVIAR